MLSSVQKRLAAGLKAILPIAVTQRLQGWWQDATIRRLLLWPPFGAVASHDLLRRTSPISRLYGADRGTSIDRYYIEDFLARHANDIRGVVLEIQDDAYTKRFGKSHVKRSEVLSVSPGSKVTIVADLTSADQIPSSTFDCIILTQTVRHLVRFRPSIARGRLWNGSPVHTFGPMTLRVRAKEEAERLIEILLRDLAEPGALFPSSAHQPAPPADRPAESEGLMGWEKAGTSFAASIKVRGSDAYPISNLEPAAAVRCPTREFPQSQRPRHRFPLSVRQHGHPGATAHSRRFRSVRDGDTLRLDPQRLALPQGSAQRTSFCFFQALLMSQKAQQSGSWTR